MLSLWFWTVEALDSKPPPPKYLLSSRRQLVPLTELVWKACSLGSTEKSGEAGHAF